MEHNRCMCDDCQGIVWPAPPPITKRDAIYMRKLAKSMGKALAEDIDKRIMGVKA